MIKSLKGFNMLRDSKAKMFGYRVFGILAVSLLPESTLAAKFDINEGVKAATDPVIGALKDHWGKGVLIVSTLAALLGEGDDRQRAVRAGVSSASAGGVVLALLAMVT